jgi:uncharacterized BrkB/YihY/UPF0761 family membrane protein
MPMLIMLALALYQLSQLSIIFLQENTASDFNDLGAQLLGGFVLAVVVAVAFTFIKFRLRNKKPPAQFISISSFQKTDETSKVGRE